MNPARCLGTSLAVALAAAFAVGQDDARDRLVMKNGKELRGRVFSRLAGNQVVLQQNTRREEIAKADIASSDVLRDRVHEFFTRLDRLPDNARNQWLLVEWAKQREMPDLARLLATDIVLRDSDHAEARAFLGHRRRGKEWLWPDGDEWLTLEAFERRHDSWGRAMVVDSEHFRVKTNGTLRAAVAAAWDLERLLEWLYERFGSSLQLYELIGNKVDFEVWRDRDSFPGLNKQKHPYFQHRIEERVPPVVRTYFEQDGTGRPVRLFEVALQGLLYRVLADDPGLASNHRRCGWGEVGLARYAERVFAGPPGRAVAGEWRVPLDEAALALRDKERRLGPMVNRSVRQLHGTVTDETATDWATAHLFVAYLLEDRQSGQGLADRFCNLLLMAVREAKGTSTVVVDRELGRKIEAFEDPFDVWVKARVQAAPTVGTGH